MNMDMKIATKTVTYTAIKNFELDGVRALNAERVTEVFELTRQLHPISNEPLRVISKKLISQVAKPLSFELTEVTAKELAVYRKRRDPSFVLKVDEKLYYTVIPNVTFLSAKILGEHLCAIVRHECKHMSAASDEDGGCEKVRNGSQGIEKYPWIVTGYETFNTRNDSFVVVECLHYEECPPRERLSVFEINNRRISIAQFLWDDVKTSSDIRSRVDRCF